MIIHMFGLRWRPAATPQDKARALAEVQAFQGVVPGLLETVAGTNTSPRGQGYEFAAMMRFKDQESLDAYQVSAVHMALLEWLVPLVDAVDLDVVGTD